MRSVLALGLLIALFAFITTRTTVGRRIYALGGNEKAANGAETVDLTGIPSLCLPAAGMPATGRLARWYYSAAAWSTAPRRATADCDTQNTR